MIYLKNRSSLKWIGIIVFIMPVLAVVDLETAFYTAPSCLLGIMVMLNVQAYVLVVTPEHLHEALYEYSNHEDVTRIIVYHKSINAFEEVMSDDYDITEIE